MEKNLVLKGLKRSSVDYCQPKKTTFSAPLAGPLEQSPPKCETQCLRQTSVRVQNFSEICSAVLKEMCPKQTDRQTDTHTHKQKT